MTVICSSGLFRDLCQCCGFHVLIKDRLVREEEKRRAELRPLAQFSEDRWDFGDGLFTQWFCVD